MMSNVIVPSTVRVEITPCLSHVARCIATIRQQGHEHCRRPEEDLGKERNSRIEYFGVLAEIVVLDALERADLKPTGYTLVANYIPQGPDFMLQGRRYQIKSVLPNNRYLCINEQQRLNPTHQADFYLPVVFESDTALQIYAPIPVADVASWLLREDGHSPYRSEDKATFSPLTSLERL